MNEITRRTALKTMGVALAASPLAYASDDASPEEFDNGDNGGNGTWAKRLTPKLVEEISDEMLPAANKKLNEEDFDLVIKEMANTRIRWPIVNKGMLQEAITEFLPSELEEDRRKVQSVIVGGMEIWFDLLQADGEYEEISSYRERAKQGVYFTHTGLLRGVCTMHKSVHRRHLTDEELADIAQMKKGKA